MTSTELAYWLQGAIEIEALTSFSDAQIATIRDRLGAVTERDTLVKKIWLILALSTAHDAFVQLRDLLEAAFIHDVDPSYEGDQAYFQSLHDGAIG